MTEGMLKGMTRIVRETLKKKPHTKYSFLQAKNKEWMNNINADCGAYLEWVNEPIRAPGCLKRCWMMISTRELDSSSTASTAVLYFQVWRISVVWKAVVFILICNSGLSSLIVVQTEGDWKGTGLACVTWIPTMLRYDWIRLILITLWPHETLFCSDSRTLPWMLHELWI